jgi:hypothetical protein
MVALLGVLAVFIALPAGFGGALSERSRGKKLRGEV